MAKLIVKGRERKDGKYRITLIFPGAPNAFGGFYPSKTFNKLYTSDQIKELFDKDYETTFEEYMTEKTLKENWSK